jgi:MFS family permease
MEYKNFLKRKEMEKFECTLREDDGYLAARMEPPTIVEEFIPPSEEKSESNLETLLLPFRNLLKLTIVVTTTPYSIAYGFMYFVIASLPQQLVLHYQLLSYQIGLSYLSNGIGNALGAYISGYLSDKALNKPKLADYEFRIDHLEARLTPMWLGIFLLPLGLLMYGWSIQREMHISFALAGLFLCK